MSELNSCDHCGGLSPQHLRRCLHCEAPSLPRKLLVGVVGGALATVLMACYGAPGGFRSTPQEPPCNPAEDSDKDKSCHPYDCDELNPDIHPRAVDLPGDGIDQNCDGKDG